MLTYTSRFKVHIQKNFDWTKMFWGHIHKNLEEDKNLGV
jgi:hypothetical protein